MVRDGEAPPAAPEGGKVKLAPISRIFPNEEFGYRTITVERPLRDDDGHVVLAPEGQDRRASRSPTARCATPRTCRCRRTSGLLRARGDAARAGRLDRPEKTKVGYEIPFNRHFYVFEPPRPLDGIDADLKAVTDRITRMIAELAAWAGRPRRW